MRQGDLAVGNDVQIHYVDGGDRGAKMTLLFVPGWSMSTEVWRDQMKMFAGVARVVAVDPRSQGLSSITTGGNTPEQRAQDLHRVIELLSLRNVVLIGWSQGVQDVASYAAAFHGEAISGYVLVDATVGAGTAAATANSEPLRQQLDRFAYYQRHPAEYLRGMLNAIIHSPEGRRRIDEYVTIGLRTPPDLGVAMMMQDFVLVDRRPALAAFTRPTLVIAAADSDEISGQRAMASAIADARFETVGDCGHAVFLDQPERFRSLLASFLRSIETTS